MTTDHVIIIIIITNQSIDVRLIKSRLDGTRSRIARELPEWTVEGSSGRTVTGIGQTHRPDVLGCGHSGGGVHGHHRVRRRPTSFASHPGRERKTSGRFFREQTRSNSVRFVHNRKRSNDVLLRLRLTAVSMSQRDADVTHLQPMTLKGVTLHRALRTARRPTSTEHEERMFGRRFHGHLDALVTDEEREGGRARRLAFVRVFIDPNHRARIDAQVGTELGTAHKVLGSQVLDAPQLAVGQLDDRSLHEVSGISKVLLLLNVLTSRLNVALHFRSRLKRDRGGAAAGQEGSGEDRSWRTLGWR